MLAFSLLLAPAAAFSLATRFPKTPATCDARRSSDAVARLGFLQDTRATEMAGAESTTYGELYPMSGFVGGVASTRGYGMGNRGYGMGGGYGGYGMGSMYGNRYGMGMGMGSMYGGYGGMNSMYGNRYGMGSMNGGYGGYGMGSMMNRGMGGMYGGGMYNQRSYGGYGGYGSM